MITPGLQPKKKDLRTIDYAPNIGGYALGAILEGDVSNSGTLKSHGQSSFSQLSVPINLGYFYMLTPTIFKKKVCRVPSCFWVLWPTLFSALGTYSFHGDSQLVDSDHPQPIINQLLQGIHQWFHIP